MLRIAAVQHYHEALLHGLVHIQELSNMYEMVSRAKTALWHRLLTPYLPLYFPDAERFRLSKFGNARLRRICLGLRPGRPPPWNPPEDGRSRSCRPSL